MKKLILLSILISSSLSFSFLDKIKSEIKLKNEEEPRFKEVKVIINNEIKMRKVIPGKYKIKLFELNYPSGVIEKNNFYNHFGEVLAKANKNTKYSILLEKRFYEDIQKLKTYEMSIQEQILEIPSSSLDAYGISELLLLTKELNLNQYLGTDQEYLNRQVYLLYQLLGKKDFNPNNVYSELDKEFLVAELKQKRKKIVEDFEKSNFEYFVKESFENTELDKFQDDSVYRFDKDIVISENVEDQAILPEIKDRVYLTDMPEKMVEDLAKNRLKLKRTLLLVENDEFHGYNYNENNTILFINGSKDNNSEPIYYYKDYKIDVVRENIDVLDLLKTSSNYYVSDFF